MRLALFVRSIVQALAALVLIVLVLGFPRPAQAQADTLPPVLVSATLEQADLVAGDTARINFTATDETGIASVIARYISPSGASFAEFAVLTPDQFFEIEITPAMANGTYILEQIDLLDTASPPNLAIYRPDGTIGSTSDGAPTSHDLDLTALNFTVSGNDGADTLPPVLVSATLEQADLVAGDTARINFTATDETGIASVIARYISPSGASFAEFAVLTPDQFFEIEITPAMANGTYVLEQIDLLDTASPPNLAIYRPDGTIGSTSDGAPTSHDLDLTALNFTVSGNEQVDDMPEVVFVGLDDTDLVAGDTATIRMGVSDASRVGSIWVRYVSPVGTGFAAHVELGDELQALIDIPTNFPDGTYSLEQIDLVDTASPPNTAIYGSDGTIWVNGSEAPVGHELYFPELGFIVTGNEFRVDRRETAAEEDEPIEIEITPVDEMEDGGGGWAADGASRDIFVTTTLGTLRAGDQTGTRVRARAVGGRRYLAELASGRSGAAIVTVEIEDRGLPPLTVVFSEGRPATMTALSGPASSERGTAITLTATVTSASGTPRGTVSFRRGETEIGTAALNAGGVASLETDSLPAGSHSLTARYAGSTDHGPSTSDALTHAVSRRDQTISFTAPPRQTLAENSSVTLRASATSELSVAFSSRTTAVCTVSGSTVTLRSAGTCTIRATQGGNADWNAAPPVDRSFVVMAPGAAGFFVGGGVVFAQRQACGPALGSRAHAVTVRYRPSELGGLPSELSLVWPEGSEHLVLWGAMTPSGDFLGAAGRQSWSRFVFYPTRPRMRVVTRQVTRPPGAALAQAEELVLRIRAQNFAAIPGCAATIAATLRRGA